MKHLCFLDIQTTGLFWRNSTITFLGLAYIEEGLNYKTWFPTNEEEEYEALLSFTEELGRYTTCYTYNGTGFDLPYLTNKCKAYEINTTLPTMHHIDMMRLVGNYKRLLKLESLKQVEVESLLQYKRVPSTSPKLALQEDLTGITQLFPLVTYLESLDADIAIISYDVVQEDTTSVFILTGSTSKSCPIPLSYYKTPYYFWAQGELIKIKVPLEKKECKLYFPNYRDYFYLPLEDNAIHKSIGSFVDKEHRKQAKAVTAYQRVTEIVLPQPTSRISPCLRVEYNDKDYYFPYKDTYFQASNNALEYLQDILQFLKQ